MLGSLRLVLFISIFSFSGSAFSQDKLCLTGSRYFYSIKNTSSFHLKVYNSKLNESKILKPSSQNIKSNYLDSWVENGNFRKSYFNRTKVYCTYDQQTFEIDYEGYEKLKGIQISQAKWRLDYNIDANLDNLLIKFGLIAISNIKTEPDDWAITKIAKGAARGSAELALKGIDYFESFEELAEINDLSDLKSYLDENYEKAVLTNEVLRKIDFLDEKSTKRAINAIVGWAENIKIYHHDFELTLREIEKSFDSNVKYIRGLKNDSYFKNQHTYTLSQIAIKPINCKTKTPTFIFSISPLHYGNSFNTDWGKPKETLFSDKDGDDEYEWEDGLINRNMAGGFKISVSPELKLSRSSLARVFLGVNYSLTSYQLSKRGSYSKSFFSQIENESNLILENPLTLDHSRLGSDLTLRMFLGKRIVFDILGGLAQNTNIINLKSTNINSGFSWSKEAIGLSDNYIKPYFGANLGMGKNKFHGGSHLLVGVNIFQFNSMSLPSEFSLEDADLDVPILFTPENIWNYRVYVGFDFSF